MKQYIWHDAMLFQKIIHLDIWKKSGRIYIELLTVVIFGWRGSWFPHLFSFRKRISVTIRKIGKRECTQERKWEAEDRIRASGHLSVLCWREQKALLGSPEPTNQLPPMADQWPASADTMCLPSPTPLLYSYPPWSPVSPLPRQLPDTVTTRPWLALCSWSLGRCLPTLHWVGSSWNMHVTQGGGGQGGSSGLPFRFSLFLSQKAKLSQTWETTYILLLRWTRKMTLSCPMWHLDWKFLWRKMQKHILGSWLINSLKVWVWGWLTRGGLYQWGKG